MPKGKKSKKAASETSFEKIVSMQGQKHVCHCKTRVKNEAHHAGPQFEACCASSGQNRFDGCGCKGSEKVRTHE